ncbi:protein-tyrosine phosphatase family protein [Actinomadura xylanilytica]|uniref:protein-tyrosine phosphatase family protein n=1 Tax=Actinomadura xylanilytica TaxID=887459 RepID=UPI00255AF956|nr:tyrosine-protein phosphatase [Actinomadura xylanilytica]MDL4772567.1 tyrosine-protein phosphatase [Actinomadura xylanilytica]
MTGTVAVDFVGVGGGMLALTRRPKAKSLPAMRSLGATHLVTLLSRREGAGAVGAAARAAGLEWVWVDLANADPPPPARDGELAKVLLDTAGSLRDGAAVVVHCSAGIHRTGMFAHALLRASGLSGDDARLTLARLRTPTSEGVGEHRLAWGEQLCTTMGWR